MYERSQQSNREGDMRITLANRCYYGLNGQLSNKDFSRTTKLIVYKTLILPALLYGAEGWTLLSIIMVRCISS